VTESRTLTVTIARRAQAVYDFLAEPGNIPRWSAFITSVQPDGDSWLATAAAQTVRIRFIARNPHGLLDHWVTAGDNPPVYVPLRVVANGDDGADVIFTVFRGTAMTEAEFTADLALVETDLKSLRRLMEAV
jgi:hypothetical protein